MKEKTLQAKIIKYMRSEGAWIVKYPGGAYAEVGVPDLVGCFKGRFFAFEVKVGNNYASEMQKHQIGLIQSSGGYAFIVYSMKKVMEIVKGWKNNEI